MIFAASFRGFAGDAAVLEGRSRQRLSRALRREEQRLRGSARTDLVFVDERPFAVLEWAAAGAAMVTIELDPAKLHAADAGGQVYEYSEVLTDPR